MDTLTSLCDGRFILAKQLGEGGMATVYQAFDRRLQVWRAIKVLLPAYGHSAKLRARFEAEARAMALLEHPHIITVHDVGSDGANAYIIMELAEGGSIQAWLDAHGPMPPRMAVDVVLQICEAIAMAHERGIIHRDIKPHNVLVGTDGLCRVTDFGIARLADPGKVLTRTGTVMGTLGFMSPEQRSNSKAVDERADVYSIGATLYTLVTNQTTMDLHAASQDEELLEGVPKPLVGIVVRAAEYRRERRYATVLELADALIQVRDALPPDPLHTPPLLRELEPPVYEGVQPTADLEAPTEEPAPGRQTLLPPKPSSETLLPPSSPSSPAETLLPPLAEQETRLRELYGRPAPRSSSAPSRSGPVRRTLLPEDDVDDSTFLPRTPPPAESSYLLYEPSEGSGLRPYTIELDDDSRRLTAELEQVDSEDEQDAEARARRDLKGGFNPFRELWLFMMQVLTAVLKFASGPGLPAILPLLAFGGVLGGVGFAGMRTISAAEEATDAAWASYESLLLEERDLFLEVGAARGKAPMLEAYYKRFEHAPTEEVRRAMAVEITRVLETESSSLPRSSQDGSSLRAMKHRVARVSAARDGYQDARESWSASASTRTGRLAISLGLADRPPPLEE